MLILAEKEINPMELLDIGPCLIEIVGEDYKVEKLEEQSDVQAQGEKKTA